MAKPGGHYILPPVYFYFFFLISINDLGNGWGQHKLSQQVVWELE